jgi:hypothetical protein
MMKTTISQSDFIREFKDYGRDDQFSNDGLCALYDALVDYDEGCGTDTELDVIALCCEFTEYADIEEFWDNYGKEDYPDTDSIQQATWERTLYGTYQTRLSEDSTDTGETQERYAV